MRSVCFFVLVVGAVGCGRLGYDTQVDPAGETPDAAAPADAANSDAPAVDLPGLDVPGLVGHYLIDGDDPGRNVTGTGADGTCTVCPDPLADQARGAVFAFRDGAYAMVEHDPRFITENGFTVALWIKPRSYDIYMTAVTKIYGSGNTNSWKLNNAADAVGFETYDGVNIKEMNIAETPLPLNTWSHVVLRWDGTTKALYHDGVLLGAEDTTIAFDDGDLYFGVDFDFGVTTQAFDGLLYDLRIYDRAVTEDEIARIIGN
ncbi:LamG domain-containing protein [Haliangium sp.]|uniref:LamG domain-containing protein n=1 Tax=Haliangium sp. TaxID=2663208 RepID=UPI003D0AD2C1